jgi:hypothetical protein
MLRLTLDANVFHELLSGKRQHHEAAARLFELARAGRVELYTTTRIELDIPDEPLRSQIASLKIAPIGTGFRLDVSRLDSPDYLVSSEDVALSSRLMNLLFPNASSESPKQQNRTADVDHLLGHLTSGNDYFVTQDRGILERTQGLLKEKIAVVQIAEAVSLAEAVQ